jgi:hypothetical protein
MTIRIAVALLYYFSRFSLLALTDVTNLQE